MVERVESIDFSSRKVKFVENLHIIALDLLAILETAVYQDINT